MVAVRALRSYVSVLHTHEYKARLDERSGKTKVSFLYICRP